VLDGVAVFFVVAAAWANWMEDSPVVAETRNIAGVNTRKGRGIVGIPWPLLVLIFGATGVDAAAGGWLTAYAQRAGDSLGITIGAATFLWVGSLVSRVVHSTKWAARLPERAVLGASMVAMTAALVLLVGLAAGPVYPLVLAAALRHRENSTVFAVAGVGASLLPLMTGGISTWAHSLRAGLGVPLAAAVVMMVVVMVSRGSLAGREAAVTEALMGSVGEK
jgi:fucose permease